MEYFVSSNRFVPFLPSHWHFLGPHSLSSRNSKVSRGGSGSYWAWLPFVEMSSHLSLSAILTRKMLHVKVLLDWPLAEKPIKALLGVIYRLNSPDIWWPQLVNSSVYCVKLSVVSWEPQQLRVWCIAKSEPCDGCLYCMSLTECCACWAKGSWAMTSHEGTKPLSSSQPDCWWNAYIVVEAACFLWDVWGWERGWGSGGGVASDASVQNAQATLGWLAVLSGGIV